MSFQKQILLILEVIQKHIHETFSEEFFGFVKIPVLVPHCAFVIRSVKQLVHCQLCFIWRYCNDHINTYSKTTHTDRQIAHPPPPRTHARTHTYTDTQNEYKQLGVQYRQFINKNVSQERLITRSAGVNDMWQFQHTIAKACRNMRWGLMCSVDCLYRFYEWVYRFRSQVSLPPKSL